MSRPRKRQPQNATSAMSMNRRMRPERLRASCSEIVGAPVVVETAAAGCGLLAAISAKKHYTGKMLGICFLILFQVLLVCTFSVEPTPPVVSIKELLFHALWTAFLPLLMEGTNLDN